MKIAVLAALFVALTGASAYAAWPYSNDVRSGIHLITAGTLDGVRVSAFDVTTTTNVLFLPVGNPANDAGDPPFISPVGEDPIPPGADLTSNCAAAGDPQSYPAITRTLWYQVVPFNSMSNTATFPERTVVTIDAVNTTYNAAIEVFQGMPPVWNTGDAAPTNVVACSQWVSGLPAPYVSFTAAPGVTYYALVGSLQSGGSLSLNMRASDVQAPALTVSADNLLPNPGDTSTFHVVADDKGSGVASRAVSVAYRGAPLTNRGVCGTSTTPPLGTYCTTFPVGTQSGDFTGDVYVSWPTTPSNGGDGTVSVTVADGAGNRSPANYTLHVRDRRPPTVLKGHASQFGSAGARIYGACSKPGTLLAQVTNASGHARNGHRHLTRVKARRYGAVITRPFRHVGHGFFTVRITCQDMAGNRSPIYTFLYIP